MNYIVLDLEWNQGNEEKEKQLKELPFEIIEIGAIRLNGQMEQSGTFHEIVRPQVYREMHHMTRQLLHMDMKELMGGRNFPEVILGQSFLWGGGGRGARARMAGENTAGGGNAVAGFPALPPGALRI